MWPALSAGCVMLVCAAVLALTLEPMSAVGGRAWPVAGAEKVLGRLAVQRRGRDRKLVHRVELWDLPGRRELGGAGPFAVYGMANGIVAPDGRRFVYVSEPRTAPGWSMPVVVADLESGSQFRVLDEAEAGVTRGLAGVSPDGGTVYVQSYHYAPGMRYSLTLEGLDVATLRWREVASVASEYTALSSGARQAPNQRFVVDDKGAWTLLTWGSGRGTTVEVSVQDGAGQRTFPVSLPPFASLDAWASPGGVDVALSPPGTTWRIDVKAESAQVLPTAPGAPMGRSADGRFELRSKSAALTLYDTRTGAAVASLATGGGTLGSGGVVSNDGRWVACEVGVAGTTTEQVVVWEVAAPPRP